MACRTVVSKTKLLFKKQFIVYQKRVKARIHTFFIQFARNWHNRDETIGRKKLRIFFFKDRSHSCSFQCIWKQALLKWKKYAKGCFKTSAWFFRTLTEILHGERLLFWLELFINFSISDSWTGLMKLILQESFLNMY